MQMNFVKLVPKSGVLLIVTFLFTLALLLSACSETTTSTSVPVVKAISTPTATVAPTLVPATPDVTNSLPAMTVVTDPFAETAKTGSGVTVTAFPGATLLELPETVQGGLSLNTGDLSLTSASFKTYSLTANPQDIIDFYTQQAKKANYYEGSQSALKVNGVTTLRQEYNSSTSGLIVIATGPLDESSINEMIGEYPELNGNLKLGLTLLIVISGQNPVS